jgi:hypothetical protein
MSASIKISLVLQFLITCMFCEAQKKSREILSMSGGLSMRSHWRSSRVNAFPTLILSGNVSLAVSKWNIPLSFSYSNKQFSYSHPFNRFGITPTLKNIKIYAGYNSMNLSRNTLSSESFLGGGIEIKRKNTVFKAGGGRFRKAISNPEYGDFTYKRIGFGTGFGFTKNKWDIALYTFYCKEIENKGNLNFLFNNIPPKENSAAELLLGLPFRKFFNLNFSYAASVIRKDKHYLFENLKRQQTGYVLNLKISGTLSDCNYSGEYESKSNSFISMGSSPVNTGSEKLAFNITQKKPGSRNSILLRQYFSRENIHRNQIRSQSDLQINRNLSSILRQQFSITLGLQKTSFKRTAQISIQSNSQYPNNEKSPVSISLNVSGQLYYSLNVKLYEEYDNPTNSCLQTKVQFRFQNRARKEEFNIAGLLLNNKVQTGRLVTSAFSMGWNKKIKMLILNLNGTARIIGKEINMQFSQKIDLRLKKLSLCAQVFQNFKNNYSPTQSLEVQTTMSYAF